MANGNHHGGDDPPVGNVIRLGKNWAAVLMPDGSILIQHLSHVCVGGSGQVIDLLNTPEHFESARYHLQEMDADRVGVRTMLLQNDGSVVTDPDAMSPSGLLSQEAYEAIPSTQESSLRYFSRHSNNSDW